MSIATVTPLNPGASSPGAGIPHDIRGKLILARLPALPQILAQLLELCQREEIGLGDLATLINRDVGLTARIFGVSNSAAYHGRDRPATLSQCLALLGMKAVKAIVINESISQVFKRLTSGRDIDLRAFWEHSLRSALIAEELARLAGYDNPEEAYLGGLIHDVGRLAMLTTEPESYRRVFSEHHDDETLCALEYQLFGLTHTEVGAWLVEKWALNSFLSDCVLYHHEPIERIVSAHPLVRLVLLADRLAHARGAERTRAAADLPGLCNISIENPQTFFDNLDRGVSRLADELGIELPAPEASASRVPDLRQEESAADNRLAAQVQEMLLVDQTLANCTDAEDGASPLRGIALALRLLFDVEASICFECTEPDGNHFKATPLSSRLSRLSQLEFTRGRSASLLARSVDAGPLLAMDADRGLQILDEQVLRALGGKGLLLLPLRTPSQRLGVLVAGIDSAARAAALQGQLACLGHFARMSAASLAQQRPALPAEQSPTEPLGADRRVAQFVHEVSNPLSIIRNYLSLLESENARLGTPQAELGIVREEIDRVSKMVRSLRQPQEAPDPIDQGPVNVNGIIEDLVALFEKSAPLPAAVSFQLELAVGLPAIDSDRDRLKQLFLNLIKNAIESMPQGGTVRAATAPWGSGGPVSHIQISIDDTGPGIQREVLSQLYRPVTSSKGGRHQGLGLAIVGQLVRELRGLINCRTDARGTSFQILLPVAGN